MVHQHEKILTSDALKYFSRKRYKKQTQNSSVYLISIFTSLLIISYVLGLSRVGQNWEILNIIKPAMLVLFFLISAYLTGDFSGSKVALFGISFFLIAGTLFTFVSVFDEATLFNIVGFVVLIGIYSTYSGEKSKNIGATFVQTIVWMAPLFTIVNLLNVANPNAYSYIRFQFLGVFTNTNAFAGFAALFCVVTMTRLLQKDTSFWARMILISTVAVLIVLLFLSQSRGAIVALSVAVLAMRIKLQYKIAGIMIAGGLAVIFLIFIISDGGIKVDRDIFAETGRAAILASSLDILRENMWVIGTGFSVDGDRIKSELSYLDLYLSAGIGFVGIATFWLLALRDALLARAEGVAIYAEPILIFILTISLVEGYLANVSSFLTVCAYVCAGICFVEARQLRQGTPRMTRKRSNISRNYR